MQAPQKTRPGVQSVIRQGSVQFSHSVISDSVTPWTAACQASLFITSSRSLLKLMSIKSLICHKTTSASVILFFSCLQSFPASGSFQMSQSFPLGGQSIGVSASASNEHSGLISFRIDWLDLLAVHGTLKSLLQHHSTKASFFWCSVFFSGPTHIHTSLLGKPYL